MTEQIDSSKEVVLKSNEGTEITPAARRAIVPEIQDFFAAYAFGYPLHLSVSEGEVNAFCSNCDMRRKEDGICSSGENDQSRYAARKWCGWAEVNGTRGQMTKEGFKPWE